MVDIWERLDIVWFKPYSRVKVPESKPSGRLVAAWTPLLCVGCPAGGPGCGERELPCGYVLTDWGVRKTPVNRRVRGVRSHVLTNNPANRHQICADAGRREMRRQSVYGEREGRSAVHGMMRLQVALHSQRIIKATLRDIFTARHWYSVRWIPRHSPCNI